MKIVIINYGAGNIQSIMFATERLLAAHAGGHVLELRNGAQVRSSRQYADRVKELLR